MQLFELSAEHEAAFLEMVEDYRKNDPVNFENLYARKKAWSASEFKAFAKEADKGRLDWRPKAKQTSLTRYVLLDPGGKIAGNGLLRFPLDEKTEKEGGNFFFDVPPSLRGKGNGALVLNGMLFEAVRAGLARALVTCLASDSPAIRAIELNRGELENTIPSPSTGKPLNRYWIRFR